ncbi:Inositol oxygenase (Myo-inositol oxygenase) [Mucor velutinosus]|uniref:Inositol oxygenase (Myo-inositol oxygenase) n=1 Tax=Mucor velutinosus TaxID=708070 RepID=A0AAN7DEM9_9FUNG|nr:Inositol oxygenase (Myo-inositol oxygenase) [Mucor velutinosus]
MIASLISISVSCFFNLCLVSGVARSLIFYAGVADGIASGVAAGVAADVADGVADGVAAASLVSFGLLFVVYAPSLVFLRWLRILRSICGCGKW